MATAVKIGVFRVAKISDHDGRLFFQKLSQKTIRAL